MPTRQFYAVFQHLSTQIDMQLAELDRVLETEVKTFSDLLREANVPAIAATTSGGSR